MNESLRAFLNEKAEKYNCKEFIKNDPVQFPHAFSDKRDVEIVAFLASVIAWGNRRMIINSGNRMFGSIMGGRPYEYVMRGEWEKADGSVNIHRTFFMRDLAYLCRGLLSLRRRWSWRYHVALKVVADQSLGMVDVKYLDRQGSPLIE